MRVLIIDNYDSFTYNLVHLVDGILNQSPTVVYNDAISLDTVAMYDAIIFSPGPGVPDEAGITKTVIQAYGASMPMLGICLGHQAIGEVFGASLINLPEVFHGVSTPVTIVESMNPLFQHMPETITVGRYHSWAIDASTLPEHLIQTAVDFSGINMGIRHIEWNIQGLQFHPESILTPIGRQLLQNWLDTLKH
ncbi:MAG: anthranilate synthase component II [Ferruginibacter sp.]